VNLKACLSFGKARAAYHFLEQIIFEDYDDLERDKTTIYPKLDFRVPYNRFHNLHPSTVCILGFGMSQRYTNKKENKIFLIYREIQSGAVAKSYMTNGLLIYGEIFSHFLIY
jgi:hypothetical protein